MPEQAEHTTPKRFWLQQLDGRRQKILTVTAEKWETPIQTIMAFTISFWLFFSARTALARETLAWDMTSSTSLASIPLSSTYKQAKLLIYTLSHSH